MRLLTILIAMELMPGDFPIAELAFAQDRTMSYVQITKVSKASGVLHLDPKNPAACGTADVNVFAFKGGSPDPAVSVSMFGLSDDPPGVMVSVSPEMQSRTIASPSAFTVLNFKVCASGNVSGKFTLQAIVASVDRAYEIKEPNPAESGRVTFDIVP
jgi:hypothetical protein